MSTSEAIIDLGAIRANVAHLKSLTTAEVMAVVKADGYGHGLVPSARAALAGGATWLGVAQLDEALALRRAGISARVLAWLWAPDEADAVGAALAAGIDISVSSTWALAIVAAKAASAGVPARIHLKIDTGLARNGATAADWGALVGMAAALEAGNGSLRKRRSAATVQVIGIWSHFIYADEPGNPTIATQIAAFTDAVAIAAELGVRPQYRHLANSAATLTLPEAHFDLVRPGIAVYGLNPVPEVPAPGLRPAMTLRSHVALTKAVGAGQGVSYGHQYVTSAPTTLALVPLGYADGVPRSATNVGPVQIGGRRGTISGRVCMDQFVVDTGAIGATEVRAGDEVVLFGVGEGSDPTAQDWADAVDTIHYEIVTRVGARVPRRYVGDLDGQ